ncbi:MAG: cobalamin B12-binding domain-containing protein, partial [Spirochaetia bacterium]
MKILLIQPPRWNFELSFVLGDQEPLGLETIAGMLPQHDIKLLDMRFEQQNLKSIIESFQPDVVGITGVTCEYHKICKVLREIKTISPRILTIVGGVHATLLP